jgi:hypothetical protein
VFECDQFLTKLTTVLEAVPLTQVFDRIPDAGILALVVCVSVAAEVPEVAA